MAKNNFLPLTTGQMVSLKSDPDKQDRLVTRIIINIDDSIQFELSLGGVLTWHYYDEINIQRKVINKIGFEIPDKNPAKAKKQNKQNEHINKSGRPPRQTSGGKKTVNKV